MSFDEEPVGCPDCKGPLFPYCHACDDVAAALRAENARLTSEVERLEAKFQQNFGCHHSWVRDHAEHRRLLSEVERLRAVQRAAMGLLSWDWMRLLPDTPVGDDVRRDADILEAALTALDAAGGEGKR